MNERCRYLSYMLRMWETSDGESQIWRASLESPGSGQRRGFADLQSLMDFLADQTERQDEHDGERETPGGMGGIRQP